MNDDELRNEAEAAYEAREHELGLALSTAYPALAERVRPLNYRLSTTGKLRRLAFIYAYEAGVLAERHRKVKP